MVAKHPYEAVYQMKEIGRFTTFKEAFKAIFDRIKAETCLSWMALETIWIQGPEKQSPFTFEEARDRAADEGWVADGKWVG